MVEFFRMDSASFSPKTSVFIGQNFGIWAVKMEAYLKAFYLWEIVESDNQLPQRDKIKELKEKINMCSLGTKEEC